MKRKNSPYKDLLFLSISSFVVVAAWVGFNIYHSWVTTTITPELQITIKPINPNFDMSVVQQLKTRNKVAPITTLNNKLAEPTPANRRDTETQTLPGLLPTPVASAQPQTLPQTQLQAPSKEQVVVPTNAPIGTIVGE